ncbi:MAG: nucleotidyltransferase domain-containing protein [Alphaproteobacteria bacterium]|nr:nucleotidyltransferase domain-containing protein [Alphaproteobacteria bacterium]
MPRSADISTYGFFSELKALPFIERLYLYGSRARQEEDTRSDIDLAVECPQAKPEDWARVRDILDRADTLLEIDCVRLDTAGKELKLNILQEGVLLYERQS